jgi:hypothetical protein
MHLLPCLALSPLSQARRTGGGPFAGSAVANLPVTFHSQISVAATCSGHGTENFRSRPSGSSSPALNFQRWRALLPPYRRPPLIFRVPLKWKLSAGVSRPGQALSLVLSLGQQRKDIMVLAFQEKMNLDHGSKTARVTEEDAPDGARPKERGSRATKVAPTNEGGHTGPPLRNAVFSLFLSPLSQARRIGGGPFAARHSIPMSVNLPTSLPPSHTEFRALWKRIECWGAKTGAGPFFGPFFGPAKKGHMVLAFQEKPYSSLPRRRPHPGSNYRDPL